MIGSEGLRNFVKNIQPLMKRMDDTTGWRGAAGKGYAGKAVKLTRDEQRTIVQFYLETVHVLSLNPESK